jgi:CRISPR system Cascade subunit CasE
MPWLSDVPINPMRRKGRDVVANPSVAHGMVCQALAAQERERTLWRLEGDGRRAHLVALTQSRPSWAHVIEAAGWEGANGGEARIANLEPLFALVAVGRRFSFKVRVNPVSYTQKPKGEKLQGKLGREREAAGGKVRGARIAARTAGQQTAWFLARTGDWGFDIPLLGGALAGTELRDLVLDERRVFSFQKGGRGGPLVTLSTATFVGNLVVTDAEKMREALVNGIGRGRAYGCGLITLGAPGELPRRG